MKKIIFQQLVLFVSYIISLSMFGMQSEVNRAKNTVKMYHCSLPENIEKILKEGLKSREQLEKEGKAEVPGHWSTPNHYSSVFFQHIDEDKLRRVRPGVWEDIILGQHCIAIEVDPDETMIYNPDLRITPPFKNASTGFDYHQKSPLYREGTYKGSGMTLLQYIATKKRFKEARCNIGCFAIQHPLTAEPMCIPIEQADNYTPYCWNEHTIQRDRIDPSEFAQ